MKIAETVSKQHPDKICDQISDAILDDCLKQDPDSRVAIETMGGHGIITITGELTTKAFSYMYRVAKKVYKDLGHKDDIGVQVNVVSQSGDIAQGVDTGGAGDQGIMVGYACNDNEQKIPQEMYLAREILKPFEADAKSQVVLNDDGSINNVVLSVQGKSKENLESYIINKFDGQEFDYYCNNTGSFEIGGFDADTGVTGRKIVVDAYGPAVPVGGGAFSGKDASKVDRSAAYMARFIALEALNFFEAEEIIVKLGYVIGKAEPLLREMFISRSPNFDTHFTQVPIEYDCRPEAIIERFNLKEPIYQDTAANGHFGRIGVLPWETI